MPSISYEVEQNPPPFMQWDEYAQHVNRGWQELLNSADATDEARLQRFLESHPCLIPGAFGLGLPSGHYPFPCGVITQPQLAGLGVKRPDFMWIAADSGTIYPTLIEIETPDKKWFTLAGVQHHDLTQAHTQLASWRAWFNNPVNQALFLDYYLIPHDLRNGRQIHPKYILIYGRRQEFTERPELNALRASLSRTDETLMTFDRLAPDPRSKEMMCVRLVESPLGRSYAAVTVPATLTLGPLESSYRAFVNGKEDAVRTNALIGEARREFLQRRIPYWDGIGRQTGFRRIDLDARE